MLGIGLTQLYSLAECQSIQSFIETIYNLNVRLSGCAREKFTYVITVGIELLLNIWMEHAMFVLQINYTLSQKFQIISDLGSLL